jgi:hypothetical protein
MGVFVMVFAGIILVALGSSYYHLVPDIAAGVGPAADDGCVHGAGGGHETFDRGIFSAAHLVSGHTLKHLAAAAAKWWILRMLEKRKPVESP